MKYPAIVYSLNDIESKFADNGVYSLIKQYSVTVIDTDPDSKLITKIAELPKSRFNRYYTSENLNHWVFSIYF